jgi:hypothetical protein
MCGDLLGERAANPTARGDSPTTRPENPRPPTHAFVMVRSRFATMCLAASWSVEGGRTNPIAKSDAFGSPRRRKVANRPGRITKDAIRMDTGTHCKPVVERSQIIRGIDVPVSDSD